MHEWVEHDSLHFLSRFEEVFGNTPPSRINEVKDSMSVHGYSAWVTNTRFIQTIMPQSIPRVDPDQDGKLPTWVYDGAKTDPTYIGTIAAWHNLHDHGVDWLLHDVDGDSLCVWGTQCNNLLVNLSPWCPQGAWNGRVSKWVGLELRQWDFGTTVGKTYVRWLADVVIDSLFMDNDAFNNAYDGVQLEDGADRNLPCWAAYKPGGGPADTLDPKSDGIGIYGCAAWMDSTASSFDSLLTHFVFELRDNGYVVRANGHDLRWAYDPNWWLDEDTLITHGFQGRKMERYGDWAGWPYSATGTVWFEIYDGLEDYYHPTGFSDAQAGWDVSALESLSDADSSAAAREHWTRFSLGQALLGDGLYAGQAADQDEYFFDYLTDPHEPEYAPVLIEEMDYELGAALAAYAKYKPLGATDSLYYRQFCVTATGQTPAKYTTVVVNMWDEELGGVPARDAQWYSGQQSTFPVSSRYLIFDHWSKGKRVGLTGQGRVPEARIREFDQRVVFDLPTAGSVRLAVHDVAGRRVRSLLDQRLPAGWHEAVWDGRNDQGARAPAGVYFYRLKAVGAEQVRRTILVK